VAEQGEAQMGSQEGNGVSGVDRDTTSLLDEMLGGSMDRRYLLHVLRLHNGDASVCYLPS
jgi:hypothetical protein